MSKARQQANLSSDGNLFADISNDRVGVGSVVPTHKLHVNGTSKFDDDVKFEGTTAAKNILWDKSADSLKISDDVKLNIGTGNDLDIYHTASGTSWIRHANTSEYFVIEGQQIDIRDYTTSKYRARFGTKVELRYDNTPRFETTNTGAKVTGNLEVTGVLTYDDVTSIDSVGIVTARLGVHIDDSIVHIGDTDTKIRFPAANNISFETTGSEALRIDSNQRVMIGSTSSGGWKFRVQVPANASYQSAVNFTNNTNADLQFEIKNSESRFGPSTNTPLVFKTNNTEKLRIDSNGYLSFAGDTNTYIHHPSADQLAITRAGASFPIIRFGSGGGGGTVAIGNTTQNLVTNSEILTVRGYSSFKSVNAAYAAIYCGSEGNTTDTANALILFNNNGANRGGIGYVPNTGELRFNNQYFLTFCTGSSVLGGTERLRITSGNVLAINKSDAPTWYTSIWSAANGGGGALHVGGATVLYEDSYSSGNDNYSIWGNNIYLGSGSQNLRLKTDHASRIYQHDGNFYFQNAGSDSAGSAITFSTPLKITSAGDVGIGVDPTSDFHLKRTVGAVINTIETTAAGGEALYKLLGKSAGGSTRTLMLRTDSGADAHRIITPDNVPIQIMTQNSTRLEVTGTGYVNRPNQPAFKATGNLTFTDWNTYEYCTWATENYDNASAWNGYSFTCPTGAAGDYLFQVEFLGPGSNSGNQKYILFALFIGTQGQNYWRQCWSDNTNRLAPFSGMVLQLAVGDVVRVAFHKSYGRPYASGYTSISGCKIN